MKYVAFDLETTGVDPFSNVPVSYAFVYDAGSICNYVNPGRPIPSEATAIHGITDAMVVDSPDLFTSLITISNILKAVWNNGNVIVGMNVSYDLTMISTQFSLPLEIGPVLDILVIDRHYDKWRKGGRKLVDLCSHYGVVLENAHSAEGDCLATLKVLQAQRDKYGFGDLSNETLRSWYKDWLVSYNIWRREQGNEPIARGQYDWPVHSEGD